MWGDGRGAGWRCVVSAAGSVVSLSECAAECGRENHVFVWLTASPLSHGRSNGSRKLGDQHADRPAPPAVSAPAVARVQAAAAAHLQPTHDRTTRPLSRC